MFQDGDNHQSFLGGFKTHILYYWHIADSYDILTKVLCVLDPTVTASSESVPTTEGGAARKRKGNYNEETKFRDKISDAMGTLGYSSICNELSKARKDALGAKLGLSKAQNEEKEVWRVAVLDASESVKELEAKKRQFN